MRGEGRVHAQPSCLPSVLAPRPSSLAPSHSNAVNKAARVEDLTGIKLVLDRTHQGNGCGRRPPDIDLSFPLRWATKYDNVSTVRRSKLTQALQGSRGARRG